MEGFCGAICIDASAAVVTVRPPDPAMVPEVAVTVRLPGTRAVAKPWDPGVLLTVAMLPSEVLQCAVPVRSCVLLSL